MFLKVQGSERPIYENEKSRDFSKLSLTNKEDVRRESVKALKKKY
jgi:hypothetical protein